MARPVVTLTTDFGLRDPYVACMKAVILSICREAVVVDITHEVSKFDVEEAAYILYRAYGFFPDGTVHVAVVDPGVGTERKPIVLKTRRYFFVGPDNGVLSLAAEEDGVEAVYAIESREVILPEVSLTFHGRDLFAPAAAWIALGYPVQKVGGRLKGFERVRLPEPSPSGDRLEARIIYVDSFGNLVTNVRVDSLKDVVEYGEVLEVRFRGVSFEAPLLRAYGEAEVGELLLIPGSGGFLEISVNMGSAADRLRLGRGDRVELRFRKT